MRLNPRYWVHVANKKLPIVHPNHPARVLWDVFVLALVLYNAVIVPYQVGYCMPHFQWLIRIVMAVLTTFRTPAFLPPCCSQVGFSTPVPEVFTPLNYAIDLAFAFDICINFRTAYFDNTATLVRYCCWLFGAGAAHRPNRSGNSLTARCTGQS
jgi:potassium voltage-gated channel Eag-related subfamily H protein 6